MSHMSSQDPDSSRKLRLLSCPGSQKALFPILSYILPLLLLVHTVASSGPVVSNKIRISRPFHSGKLNGTSTSPQSSQAVQSASSSATTASSLPYKPIGISYHGGPIMYKGLNLYLIWYGSWSSTDKALILGFISSLSPSNSLKAGTVANWWGISTQYFNNRGKFVQRKVKLAGQTSDRYSFGKVAITADGFANVVYNAVSARKLPSDTEALYLVLTSKDVQPEGFCSSFCGYHSAYTLNSAYYKFGVVGHAGRCVKQCSLSSPNGVPGIDGTISTIAHELSEVVTDPLGNAWYDSSGKECCDKCSWTFGATKKASNGQAYNLVGAKGKKYVVQRNWSPKKGICTLYS